MTRRGKGVESVMDIPISPLLWDKFRFSLPPASKLIMQGAGPSLFEGPVSCLHPARLVWKYSFPRVGTPKHKETPYTVSFTVHSSIANVIVDF